MERMPSTVLVKGLPLNNVEEANMARKSTKYVTTIYDIHICKSIVVNWSRTPPKSSARRHFQRLERESGAAREKKWSASLNERNGTDWLLARLRFIFYLLFHEMTIIFICCCLWNATVPWLFAQLLWGRLNALTLRWGMFWI